jgi:uncharacterized repeat protein (TIGR01451 family)
MLAATNTAHEGTQLSVYAGRVDSETISLLAINKAEAPLTATILVSGFGPLVGGLVYEARADSLGAQSVSYNGQNNPSDDLTSAPPAAFGPSITHVLPPLSVSLFHLKGQNALMLEVNPATALVGGSVLLTATVSDPFGAPVADGTTVTFSTSLGNISPFTATTIGGAATATLSSTISGVATVTATVSSLSATALVTFTPGAPFTFTFTLTPTVIVANGISQSVGTATVVDRYGNPVSGVSVNFLAAIGAFSPTSSATNASGQVTATLTSLIPAAEYVSATVSGVGVRSALATYVNPPASSAPLTATLRAVPHASGVVRKGDLITYTVTITNNGPGQVNNVSIIAPIPISTTYVAGSANGCYIGDSTATWMGNLPSNASHTLSYVVQVQILEGQVVKQPTVLVDGADTGITLGSAVDVVAYKAYLPTVRRAP